MIQEATEVVHKRIRAEIVFAELEKTFLGEDRSEVK